MITITEKLVRAGELIASAQERNEAAPAPTQDVAILEALEHLGDVLHVVVWRLAMQDEGIAE